MRRAHRVGDRLTGRLLRKLPLGLAATSVAIAVATTLFTLAVYLPTVSTPHTVLEGVPHAVSPLPRSPALARRVAVVVLDGLSFADAQRLPELEPLRRRGVTRSLAVGFPTFTSPALVSFMTGLGPRDSGIRLNGLRPGAAGLDSLMRAAGEARLPVSVFEQGYGDFGRLLAPPDGARRHGGSLSVFVDMVRRGVEPPAARPAPGETARAFDLLHFGRIDDEGHAHGARSPQYAEASRDGALFAVRYAASLDLAEDALIVVSDHGHVARGGHGGDEPEVEHALFLAVGRPFPAGVTLGERPMRDVASTLAVVLGLRAPTSSLGLPMMDALTLPAPDAARALAAPFDQSANLSCRLAPAPACAEVPPVAARLAAGDAAALGAAEQVHASVSRELDQRLSARRAEGARRRLAIAGAVIALGLVALWARVRARLRAGDVTLPAAAIALPFVNLAAYLAYFGGIGYRPGFSFLKAAGGLVLDATPGGILAAAFVTLFAVRFRVGPWGPWVLLLGTAIPFALLAAWVGWDPVTPPPNIAGAAVFQLGPAVIAAATGALVSAVVRSRRAGHA